LKEAHLDGARLSGADLQGADLKAAHLQDATLMYAHLQGADLKEAYLEGARLSGAYLQGADLNKALLWGADLHNAQLQGAHLRDAQLQGARLSGANLQGADLNKALLWGADLFDAQLQGADLHNAQLQGAYLFDAQLQGADLRDAQLQGADLRDAQLQGADLSGADLQGADLSYSNIYAAITDTKTRTKFIDARNAVWEPMSNEMLGSLITIIQTSIADSARQKKSVDRLKKATQPDAPKLRVQFCFAEGGVPLICAKHDDPEKPDELKAYAHQLYTFLSQLACKSPNIARGIIRQMPDKKGTGSSREGLGVELKKRLGDEDCIGLQDLSAEEKKKLRDMQEVNAVP
jgi:uncharacterized protein YjbI with pentapeptide repeats